MNRKQFIFLTIALAFIGGAGLILFKRNQASWTALEVKMGDKVLPNFRFNDVAAIHVKGGSDVNVLRKNGQWIVQERSDYPANYHQVKELLMKIRDLKVVQSETIGRSQLSRVNLDEPGKSSGGGTLIEFKDERGKVIDGVLVGKKHARQQNESASSGLEGLFNGRYILLPSDPKNVLLISDDLASVVPEAAAWLSRDFFKIENVKSFSMTSPDPTNSWKVSRESQTSQWVLVNSNPGEVLDTNLATQTSEMLEFPSFIDVLSKEVGIKEGLAQPKIVTIETFKQFTYILKIGAKRETTYPMTVEVTAHIPNDQVVGSSDEKVDQKELQEEITKLRSKLAKEQALASWVYAVDSWIEPLIRDRNQILEKKTILSERTRTATQ
jgi:hypothetical protein